MRTTEEKVPLLYQLLCEVMFIHAGRKPLINTGIIELMIGDEYKAILNTSKETAKGIMELDQFHAVIMLPKTGFPLATLGPGGGMIMMTGDDDEAILIERLEKMKKELEA